MNSNYFTNPSIASGGLAAQYYDGYWNDNLNFFAQNQLVLSRNDSTIDFAGNSWNLGNTSLADLETFSVRWQGYINIPITGNYTFYLNSDDASYLFLDGAVFSPSASNSTVNNGGLHPPTERSGTAYLTAGLHDILMFYGENTGVEVMLFSWSSVDGNIPKQTVPNSALFTLQPDPVSNPGTLSFDNTSYSVNENGTANITINRTGGSDGAVSATITYTGGTATAPSDYNNTPITVSFASGETSKTITIPLVNDLQFEPDETINLTLTNATGGATLGTQNTATLTIVSDDFPTDAVLLDPTPYLSLADSPFNAQTFDYFYLENFEDGVLNTLGVTINQGSLSSSFAADSVDADDGIIDGSGLNGKSLWHPDSITFSFDSGILGKLPTHVGIVFTDDTPGGLITFEAFDKNGISLGTKSANLGDNSFYGTTGEDRFFGVIYPEGISKILINDNNSPNNLEVDHLQYGFLTTDIDDAGIIAFSNSQFSVNEDGTPVTQITLNRTGGSNGSVSQYCSQIMRVQRL